MDYSFDCTQVVAVRKTNRLEEPEFGEVCQSLSRIWGGNVKTKKQIEPVKTEYIQLYCDTSLELFEFEDKEFVGEFEDWQDIKQVPERITKFIECISKLAEYGYDIEKVFVINTPTNINGRVYETTIEPLSDAIYCMSLFYTGDGAGCETLIINLKNRVLI